MLERANLQEIAAFCARQPAVFTPAKNRLARSWFESKNYDEAIRLLSESVSFAPPPDRATETHGQPARCATIRR